MADFPNLQPIPGIGPSGRLIIAGPCSAESAEQMMDVAGQLAAGGIGVLRAGVWKPRTYPGGFEGCGAVALEWMAQAKAATGMLTATEVATPDHLHAAIDSGIDIVWIGARTAADPFAVQEIANALSDIEHKPAVMVKNPVSPDPDLWIGALQRIYAAGVRRLAAIHRGFTTYGNSIYRNRPRWSIPFELRRQIPSLPIVCDPSHIAGNSKLVETVASAAIDMGFDGLIIETHPCPECALSDAHQQLTPAQLFELLSHLRHNSSAEPAHSQLLRQYRQHIDKIDHQLLDLLAQRMNISAEIGQIKKQHELSAMQPQRYAQMLAERCASGADLGLSPDLLTKLWTLIHEESVRRQLQILSQK